MANYYNNGGFSNRRTSYGSGGLIYNPTAFAESAGTISVRTMRTGSQVGPATPIGPGSDQIPFSPAYPVGNSFYTFPAIDSSWDPDIDLGFVWIHSHAVT